MRELHMEKNGKYKCTYNWRAENAEEKKIKIKHWCIKQIKR